MKRDEGDPRLGWLEAFVATAQHLDFQLAADELGLSATIVKQSVEKLERWLHKILIVDDGPLELYSVDGAQFLPIASGILKSVRSINQGGAISGGGVTGASPALSSVRLSELESFLSIAKHGNYKSSAHQMKCSGSQIRRDVKKLEDVFGCALLAGWSRIEPTPLGHQFAELATGIVFILRESVADISADALLKHRVIAGRNVILARKSELNVIIGRADRKARPTKMDLRQAKAAREQLILLDGVLRGFGSFLSEGEAKPSLTLPPGHAAYR